jgi:hypothetical protein
VNYEVCSNLCDPKVGWRACCKCVLIISSLSLIHYQFFKHGVRARLLLKKREFELHSVIVHSKVLEFWMLLKKMYLNKIMTFRFDFQNFKKFNDHNFHT